jgi:hypothetical protein
MKKIKTSTTNNPSKFIQKKMSEKNQGFFTEKKYINSKLQINQENENEYNLKLDTKVLSSVFKYNFENSLEPPKLRNETVLNFQKFSKFSFNPFETDTPSDFKKTEIFSPLFQYGAKYIINDIHKSMYNNIDSVIKLQSNLRGYLVKKKLRINSLNKIYFEKKSIKSIIFIQKYIRGFLSRINIRKKIIIKFIYQKRKSAAELIIKKMQSYVNVIKMKKLLFINYHLEQRKQKAIFIQETFRNYKFYNSFKKLMKEMNEKYFIIYPCKGNKVEIIIYLEENNNLIPRKYTFYYNKLLKCFTLFINPEKLYAGKYKCQFVIDDIVICDKNYPYIQYKNELYNIIAFNINRRKKVEKRKKRKEKSKNNNRNSDNSNENTKKINYNSILAKAGKNFKNNFYQEEEYNDELEDIKEEEDEGKSTTSKDNINELRSSKINKDYIDDDLDFTEEDIINIKRLKGNNIILTDYQKLKEELMYKNPVSKEEKIRRTSFKSFNFNY